MIVRYSLADSFMLIIGSGMKSWDAAVGVQTAAQTAEFEAIQLLTWERTLWVDITYTETAQTVRDSHQG